MYIVCRGYELSHIFSTSENTKKRFSFGLIGLIGLHHQDFGSTELNFP
jgi:hypothetical protein